MMDDAEKLWDMLLSRHPESILDAFHSLSSDEQGHVINHLKKMTSEEGWHSEQILSAITALDVLKNAKKL
jgi:hypothetical protein